MELAPTVLQEETNKYCSEKGSCLQDQNTTLDTKQTNHNLENVTQYVQDNVTQIELENITQIELENAPWIHPEIKNITEIFQENIAQINHVTQSSVYFRNFTQLKQENVTEISNKNTTPFDLGKVPLPQVENNTVFNVENVTQDDPNSNQSAAIDLFSVITRHFTTMTRDHSIINKTDRNYNSLQNNNCLQITVVVVLILQPVLFALIAVLWCKYRRQGVLQNVFRGRQGLPSLYRHRGEPDYSSIRIREQPEMSMYQINAVSNVTDSVAINEYEDLTRDNDKNDYTPLDTTAQQVLP